MSKRTRRRSCLVPVLIFLLLFVTLWYATSESLHTVSYTLTTDKVTSPVRLVLLTDLHSCYYGENQEKLLSAINKAKPDLICMVGDIFDDEAPHQGTITLLDGLTAGDRYPCYYVTGNHEHWSEEVWVLKALMTSYGVTVLAGDSVTLTIGDTTLQLSGIDDPTGFYDTGMAGVPEPESWLGQLAMVTENATDTPYYSILLSHRPEKVTEYAASPFDLVLSGHAHGGQVRIPFLLNGLFAPNQGYFPAYAGGKYTLTDTTTMIVSRGLAKSDLPRIFNRPEVVVVNIEPK